MGAVRRNLTPVEKYEEAAFELAVYKQLMKERDMAQKPLDDETEKRLEEQYERSLPARLKIIDSQTRRQAFRNSLRKNVPRILKIAAAFILILNLGLTIAVASSGTVRAYVMDFFVSVNESYAEIGFYETGTTVEIPDGWLGSCYPTYVPEGFEIAQVISHSDMSSVIYLDQNERSLKFKIYSANAYVNIDSENADISFEEILGINATVISNEDIISIVMPYGNHFIVIHMDGSLDETLAVANSIRNIQN